MEKFEKIITTVLKIAGLALGAFILYWGFYFIFFIIKSLINAF